MSNRKDKPGAASGKEADILRPVGGADFQGTAFLGWGLGKAHQDSEIVFHHPGICRFYRWLTSMSLLSHFCKQGELVGPTPRVVVRRR